MEIMAYLTVICAVYGLVFLPIDIARECRKIISKLK